MAKKAFGNDLGYRREQREATMLLNALEELRIKDPNKGSESDDTDKGDVPDIKVANAQVSAGESADEVLEKDDMRLRKIQRM